MLEEIKKTNSENLIDLERFNNDNVLKFCPIA